MTSLVQDHGDSRPTVDRKLSVADLSPDQKQVYDAMLSWAVDGSPEKILTVGGYAGTGKSTLVGVLAAELAKRKKLVAYDTYTGRAASVLQRKLRASGVDTTATPRTAEEAKVEGRRGGLPLCSTIHSLLYRPVIDPKTEEVRGWEKRTRLDRDYALIVVDEASMVSDEILQDIARHGVPLLAVGDHGQLPPVAARGDLMQNPTLRLEKIHRQAEGNPIIALARHVREGGKLGAFKLPAGADASAVRMIFKKQLRDALRDAYASAGVPLGADAVLNVGLMCWKNVTRVSLNTTARELLGFKGLPQAGEIVICLRNRPPVYNGMRGVLKRPAQQTFPRWNVELAIEFPDEQVTDTANAFVPQFNRAKTFASMDEIEPLGLPIERMSQAGALYDFGYCLSVHKSQGSQFDQAIFFLDRQEEPHLEEWRRFAYTAVTRAARKLTVVR